MKILPLILAAALAGIAPAAAQNAGGGNAIAGEPAAQNTTTMPDQGTTRTPATPGQTETLTPETFAVRMAVINQFEILSSTEALEKATSDEVKAFAQQMMDEHQKAGPLLASAAEGQGIELPTELEESYQGKLDAMTGLEGEAFDEAYISAQVTAHEEAIALVDTYRDINDETPLNFFASDMAPALQAHLEHAKQLEGND